MKIALSAFVLIGCAAGAVSAQEAGAPSALVQVAPLEHRTLTRTVSGFGSVEFGPDGTVDLNFAKPGRVGRVLAAPGQRVRRGETLVEISADPSATLAYEQARNALRFAREEMDRTRSLFAQQLATRAEVSAAERALADAEHALAAQRAMGAQVARDRLVAPADGLILAVSVAPGNRFAAGANLVQMARADRLRVMLGVEPEDGRDLHVGMTVSLVSVTDPRDTEEGTVAWVAGRIDSRTGLRAVAVRVGAGALLPGTQVRGEIAVERRRVLAVPRRAVLKDGEQAYLFQVADHRARRVAVQTGIGDAEWTEVRGPVSPGEPVVVLGNYELQDGMTVREAQR